MFSNVINPVFGNVLKPVFGGGGGGGSVPFDYDANTRWWDFKNTANVKELTGDDTFALVPDRLHGLQGLEQANKSLQPLVVTDGLNLNKDTPRQMYVDNQDGLANGTNGWYSAFNFKLSTFNCYILSIARNVSSTPSRGELYVTGSRNIRVRLANNDGSSMSSIGFTSQITADTWYSCEVLVDISSGSATLTVWLNGVEQTLQSNTPITHTTTFPATDPSEFTFGNLSTTDLDSFDGDMQQLFFQNGVPTTAIRESISAYINGERP